jgi:hypothetical protein
MTLDDLMALPLSSDDDVLRIGDHVVVAHPRAVRDWANKLARVASNVDDAQFRARARAEREARIQDVIERQKLTHVSARKTGGWDRVFAPARNAHGLPVVISESFYNTGVLVRAAEHWSEVEEGPDVECRISGGRKWRTREQFKADGLHTSTFVAEWRLCGGSGE